MLSLEKATKYYQLAQTQATLFSKDPNKKVGAIILKPGSHQILSMGYNGFPRGVDETLPSRWEKPIKYKYVEHAERNAIYNASRHGTPLEGSILVTTLFPCSDCARAIIQGGIRTIVTKQPNFSDDHYGDDFKISIEMFNEVGIVVLYIDEK